jgi:hypothetical protein
MTPHLTLKERLLSTRTDSLVPIHRCIALNARNLRHARSLVKELYQLVAGKWCPTLDMNKAKPVIIFRYTNVVSSLYLIPQEIINSQRATTGIIGHPT